MWRRFLRRLHPFQLQPMSNELIDRILRPPGIGDDRRFRPLRSFEGPVTGILRPLGNPLFQNLLLFCSQRFLCDQWRHLKIGIMRIDTSDQLALFRMSGHDCQLATFSRSDRVVSDIQAKITLTAAFIEPMATPAMVRQDRPYLLIETNRLLRLSDRFFIVGDATQGDSCDQRKTES